MIMSGVALHLSLSLIHYYTYFFFSLGLSLPSQQSAVSEEPNNNRNFAAMADVRNIYDKIILLNIISTIVMIHYCIHIRFFPWYICCA